VAKFNSSQSSACWRECGEQATHTLIFWECPILVPYWTNVFGFINTIFQVPRDPLIAILGVKTDLIKSEKRRYLLRILLVAAKKNITIKWLQRRPPALDECLRTVREIYEMEKITYSL
uniref:Uncharacterized protein n=1 Tax=Sinocyclocheilus anshuiensis TaxID=1608454 RepID=A0A671KX02_9TELE